MGGLGADLGAAADRDARPLDSPADSRVLAERSAADTPRGATGAEEPIPGGKGQRRRGPELEGTGAGPEGVWQTWSVPAAETEKVGLPDALEEVPDTSLPGNPAGGWLPKADVARGVASGEEGGEAKAPARALEPQMVKPAGVRDQAARSQLTKTV